jgi:hypothetical protein
VKVNKTDPLKKYFSFYNFFLSSHSKTKCYMIKFNELKVGDYVIAEYEGKLSEGEVTDLNGDEKQIEVTTDVQAFWYDSEHLHPIPLSDEQLMRLSFTKQDGETANEIHERFF